MYVLMSVILLGISTAILAYRFFRSEKENRNLRDFIGCIDTDFWEEEIK